jgi:hypothetical protein
MKRLFQLGALSFSKIINTPSYQYRRRLKMLLSEFGKLEKSDPIVYDIIVDDDLLTPPEGLLQIGLKYKGTTKIDDSLIDAIIAFSLSGVDVIVEVDPDQDVDAQELLTIAGNAGFSISLLPPETEEGLEHWKNQCSKWAQAYLQTPNFTGGLYPVSGYFGYLTAKAATGVEAITPSDGYANMRYVSKVPHEWSDEAKESMYNTFCEMSGGEEEFQTFLKALVESILLTNLEILENDKHMEETSPEVDNG